MQNLDSLNGNSANINKWKGSKKQEQELLRVQDTMDKITCMGGGNDTVHKSHLNRGLDDLATFGTESLLL